MKSKYYVDPLLAKLTDGMNPAETRSLALACLVVGNLLMAMRRAKLKAARRPNASHAIPPPHKA